MGVSWHEAREIVFEEIARNADVTEATVEVFYRVGMRCLIDVAGERAENEYWTMLDLAMRMRAVAGLFVSFTVGMSVGTPVLLPRSEGERWLTWHCQWRQILAYLWDHQESFAGASDLKLTEEDVAATLAVIDRWTGRYRHELIAREYLILSVEELRGTSGISTGLLMSFIGREKLAHFAQQMNGLIPALRDAVREIRPGNSTLN